MGFVTRVSFTLFYSMWNSRQGWGVSSFCYYNHYNVWALGSQDFFYNFV